jgi:hypothetical protein
LGEGELEEVAPLPPTAAIGWRGGIDAGFKNNKSQVSIVEPNPND